jgi:peptide/nickel transport system permease protein
MRALLRRLGFYLLAAWVAPTLAFLLPRLVPGDPVAGAIARAKSSGSCNTECVNAVKLQLGAAGDANLWDQYLRSMAGFIMSMRNQMITTWTRTMC